MTKLYAKYMSLILDTKPSKVWQVTRFILHWLSLPIKLIVIGSLGGYQIVRQKLFTKVRALPAPATEEQKKEYFNFIKDRLPIMKKDGLELYVNRVPYYEGCMGYNHNFDHQAARQGTYAFLMGKLEKRNREMDFAVAKHILKDGMLARGYKLNPYEGEWFHNTASVSGDMLVGVSLSMLNYSKNEYGNDVVLIKEYYDRMLASIVDNDYSILEGQKPEDASEGNLTLWNEIEEYNKKAIVKRTMKSNRANWQPGLETVGAQGLTILAAMRIGDKIVGASYAKKEYRKLLWRYGYGLLSLIPTAFTQSKRGYFNDHNCMVCLYILSKLSDSKLGKLFWKIPMVYVWLLSKKWHNGYFTGLLNDAHPGTVSKKYIEACKAYLYEEKPIQWAYSDSAMFPPKEVPVKFNDMNQDEFSPDMPQTLLFPPGIEKDLRDQVMGGLEKRRSGLGWLACAIMLEDDNGKRFIT